MMGDKEKEWAEELEFGDLKAPLCKGGCQRS